MAQFLTPGKKSPKKPKFVEVIFGPPAEERRWVSQWWEELTDDHAQSPSIGIPDASKNELYAQAQEIARKIPLVGELKAGEPSVGLVYGSVQSGKTGAMVGLAANAFDLGYTHVVVLSGTIIPLLEQTTDRFVSTLLRRGEEIVEGTYTHHRGVGFHGSLGEKEACFTTRSQVKETSDFELHLELTTGAYRHGKKVLTTVLKKAGRIESWKSKGLTQYILAADQMIARQLKSLGSDEAITGESARGGFAEVEPKILIIDDDVLSKV